MTAVRRSGRIMVLAASLALISACGGPAATPFVAPTSRPPAPTATPWTLSTQISYQPNAVLGDTFDITIDVTNTGRAANPATSVQVDGLSNHADLATCSPDCTTSGFLGASYGTFAGIPAGGSATLTMTFQTTKLGRISPFVCVYDGEPGKGARVGDCGQANVVIGG